MKKNITGILILLVTTFSYSQAKQKRIQALKVAHITEQLDLTAEEAEKFWPIYNAFENKNQEFRRDKLENKRDLNLDNLTEAEALKFIKDFEEKAEREFKVRKQYSKDLLKVLPAKKVLKLHQAERDFRRKMFNEFKRRRGRHRP